jgi:hypothetical protein
MPLARPALKVLVRDEGPDAASGLVPGKSAPLPSAVPAQAAPRHGSAASRDDGTNALPVGDVLRTDQLQERR